MERLLLKHRRKNIPPKQPKKFQNTKNNSFAIDFAVVR
jgi:hypothetical protein